MVNNKTTGFEDSFLNVKQCFRISIYRSQCGESLCERILKKNLRTLLKIRNQFNRVLNQENPEPRI